MKDCAREAEREDGLMKTVRLAFRPIPEPADFDAAIANEIEKSPPSDADFLRRTYEMILEEPEPDFWKKRFYQAMMNDPLSVQSMSAHLIRTREQSPHKDLLHFWLVRERQVGWTDILKRNGHFISTPPPSRPDLD